MRQPFLDERERARKVQRAITGLAVDCPLVTQVTSEVVAALAAADAYAVARTAHDLKTVEMDLREEQLTEQMAVLRGQAYHLVLGIPGQGVNSSLLPLMDYKRAVDRSASGTPEATVPSFSGVAPDAGL